MNENKYWYKDAIIYELHIKAFSDSNGDGTGDFEGLIDKLDYLSDLGVTAIWVLPFYPSPLRDDGYDIADYYSINPSYGNITQFKKLLEAAHKRNLKVITELVINHTSDQHPWFQQARLSAKGSVERDYYVWTDDPRQWKDVRIIFQDFEASNWTWDPVAQQYYWHRFFHHQPDLNFDSPRVQEEVFRIIDYWCSMGVDGFRLDAVPYLFEREGTNGENLPETHAFLKKLRTYVDQRHPATVFLAEANMWPEDSASYFGNGDECHMNYHFPVMPRIFMSLRMEDRYPITDIFDQTPQIPENCQWAIFLRNHDELTLEMVTDEERDYMYKVYAKDPKARINLGIRHRLAPLMENNRRKIELLNCLLFSLQGTPVIYYGDEIGMGDNFYLGDRDGVRTPMQWSPDRNAGFSKANPQQLYLPLILDPEYHYGSVNVETQQHNPSSLLWFMKRMISMRKQYKSFGRGDMKFINLDNPKILAFTRSYENQIMLVVVNLSRYSQPAELDLAEFKGYQPVEVFSRNKFPVIRDGIPYLLTLDSYAYEWFSLQPTADLVVEHTTLPMVSINEWKDISQGYVLNQLCTEILPEYLMNAPWYLGKQRALSTITILRSTEIDTGSQTMVLLLVEISYESGLPDNYFLPLAAMTEQDTLPFKADFPYAVICRLQVGDHESLLCDAVFSPEVQGYFYRSMADNTGMATITTEISYETNEKLKQYVRDHQDVKSKVLPSMPMFTALAYDNNYFLKIYRKVERTLNPDVEMTRFFTRQHNAPFIPQFAGTINWYMDGMELTIGLFQEYVEYHGNGKTYMEERLNNLQDKITARKKKELPSLDLRKSITEPVDYEALSELLREFLGAPLAEGTRLIGARLADLHCRAASGQLSRDFAPEPFSLHYQRSLFAGMQTLVRTVFQNLARKISSLPAPLQEDAKKTLDHKNEVLAILKKIYSKKFDVAKIRIHGYFTLNHVLYTGKDVAIPYLGGDPFRSYSERRLKRSPLRDLASMMSSLYYTARVALITNRTPEETFRLSPYYDLWAQYASGFFIHSYIEALKKNSFLPTDRKDLNILLRTYLLEVALQNLQYELNHRPDWIGIPMGMIHNILTTE